MTGDINFYLCFHTKNKNSTNLSHDKKGFTHNNMLISHDC